MVGIFQFGLLVVVDLSVSSCIAITKFKGISPYHCYCHLDSRLLARMTDWGIFVSYGAGVAVWMAMVWKVFIGTMSSRTAKQQTAVILAAPFIRHPLRFCDTFPLAKIITHVAR